MPADNPARMNSEDAAAEISRILEGADLFIATDYREGRIFLAGEVDSPENRQAVLDVAHGVADPLGIPLSESITVVPEYPDASGELAGAEDLGGFGYVPSDDAEIELEPDFDDPVETRITEDSETYFPPTDPVVRPSDGPEQLEVVGGLSATSMDPEPGSDSGAPPGDEEISDIVRRELLEDALTTDLQLEVETINRVVILRGEVEHQDDADNAASVAGRIDWVSDVRDETIVRPRRQQ